MIEPTEHIEDLIGKVLAGEASADENRRVKLWVGESAANRAYFTQLETIFQKSGGIPATQQFDADAAWNRMKAKLANGDPAKVVHLQPWNTVYFKVAASVVMAVAIGYFAIQFFTPSQRQEVIATNTTVSDTLPDGTTVFLNKQSEVKYTLDKKKKQRLVQLRGEAFFEIKEKKEENFIVQVDRLFIRDIGTSFNVKETPEQTEVVVEEGQVMLFTDDKDGITLLAGEKGIYLKTEGTFSKEVPEENVVAYKTRVFSFTDSDLGSLVKTINAVYDQKLEIAPELAGCRVTVSFDNDNLIEIANVLAETLDLKIEQSANGVRLSGAGCAE